MGNTIYPEIIGNIFNSVRERVTNVVGNLLSSRMAMVVGQEKQYTTTTTTHQQQMDQKQEIKQSNKKVSPLSIMDAGMNNDHQNKLNLEKVAKKLESEKFNGGSSSTNTKDEAIKVEQIKDGEVDKRLIGHVTEAKTNNNNEKISFDSNNNNEILLKNVEKLMENITRSDTLGRRLTSSNSTNKIIDAFFDLDSDDIFYESERNSSNQKIVQRPRLFPLIFSSLVKYRNQSEMGFLQNITRKERNRIRALYMLRPIIGMLRRKAENSRVRQQLREMENIMSKMVTLTNAMAIARKENNRTNLSMAHEQLTKQQELMRMRAKLAFSNGFDKHFRQQQTKTNQRITTTHIQRLQQQEDPKFDENNTIIGDFESSSHNNASPEQQENDNDDDDDNDDEDNSSSDESDETKSFGETFGILVLELIGTVAGLTWGAFSQLSQYLQGMGN